MMKIAFLKSHFATFGGLEKYTLKLADAFAKQNCEVYLLTTSLEKLPQVDENIHIISLGRRSKFSLYHLLHFDHLCKKWLQHNPMDCVFGMERNRYQSHYRAGSGVHAAFLRQRQLLESPLKKLSFSLNPLHRTLLKLEKDAFENPSIKKIFANSEMVKEEIAAHFSLPEQKIEVIHNGVEWEGFQHPFEASLEPNYRLELLQQMRLPQNAKHYFLFIGNGYKRKGLSFLMEGLALLQEDFHLLVVGKDKNISRYQNLACTLGLKKKITFMAPSPNPIPYYQVADTLLLPTIYDPFANVTLEALAMGLFVVTSPFNGAKEILTKECGTVIKDIFEPEYIKKSLETVFSHLKNFENGIKRRNQIKYLDFSLQLNKIVDSTIKSI